MRVIAYSSDDQIGFKLIPENDSDRVILKVFDCQNVSQSRQLYYSSQSMGFEMTEIYIYGGPKHD